MKDFFGSPLILPSLVKTEKTKFAGGFSEYRDEDAPVIYDVEEERILLKKGTHLFTEDFVIIKHEVPYRIGLVLICVIDLTS